MTVPSATNRVSYNGAGSTATFSYTFKIFDQDDLDVFVVETATGDETPLVITTDYTVTGVGVLAGGTVVLVDASQAWLDGSGYLKTGWELVIRRIVDITQETSITSQGPNLPELHEKAFDRFTMVDQQQQDQIDRSPKLPDGEDPADFDMTLPPVADRANAGFGFDADGNPTALEFTTVGSPITASYITASAEGALSAERVLTGTANQITVTDNGANSTIVLSIPSAPTLAGNVTVGNLTDSALTAGRVVVAGTAGLLATDAGMTYDTATDILTLAGALKLTPAAAPASANGNMWSDSTQIAPATRTGGMTEYGVRCIYSQVADVTVASSAVIVTLMGAAAFGSSTIQSTIGAAGKILRVIGWGTFAITGTPTLTLSLWKSNTGSVVTNCTFTTAAAGNWRYEALVKFIDATNVDFFSVLTGATSAGASAFSSAHYGASGALGTNPPIGLAATWSASSSSNTITCKGITIEVIG